MSRWPGAPTPCPEAKQKTVRKHEVYCLASHWFGGCETVPRLHTRNKACRRRTNDMASSQIKQIEWSWHGGAQHPCYTIANLKGHVNGVSYEDMIWGILYQVNDKPFTGVEF